jgi:hypothetical protein
VQEHVVEDAPERVRRIVPPGRVLDRFGDRDAEASGRLRLLGEDRASGLVSSEGLETISAPQALIIERRAGFCS